MNPKRALLQATEDLTLCFTAACERLRQEGTTAEQLYLELQKARFLLQEARDRIDILVARLAKLAARSRPHDSPELRFRILEQMRSYMLSVQETARRLPRHTADHLQLARRTQAGPRGHNDRIERRPRPPAAPLLRCRASRDPPR